MEAIFVLVPISLAIVFGAIVVFLWAVKNEQFEDLDKEAERILFEDQQDREGGGDPLPGNHSEQIKQ